MEYQYEEMIKKNLELTQENNKMLHSMRRSMMLASFFRYLYYIIIVGTAIGIFYYIQPYVDDTVGIYSNLKAELKNLSDILDKKTIN